MVNHFKDVDTFGVRLLGLPQQNTTVQMAYTIGIYFLIVLEARNLSSRYLLGWLLLRPLSLVYRCPSSPRVFTWSFLCLCVCVLIFHKETSHVGLRVTLMTLFYPNYLFKGLISKNSQSEVLRISTSTYAFWSDTIQSTITLLIFLCRPENF